MRAKLTILGCGSSEGVPRIDGFWGNCKKNNKKNVRSRCSAIINKGKNSILIEDCCIGQCNSSSKAGCNLLV